MLQVVNVKGSIWVKNKWEIILKSRTALVKNSHYFLISAVFIAINLSTVPSLMKKVSLLKGFLQTLYYGCLTFHSFHPHSESMGCISRFVICKKRDLQHRCCYAKIIFSKHVVLSQLPINCLLIVH